MNEVLNVAIQSDPGQYVRAMSTAQSATDKFGAALQVLGATAMTTQGVFDKISVGLQKVGRNFAATGAGWAVALGGATFKAVQFDSAMRNVFTVANTADGSMGKMGAAVLKMSRSLPQGANDLAAGLYDIESSGIKGADALKVLEAAGIAASAGLTNTATAARTINAVLNAYGKSASEVNDVSDTLFQTVNYGVLNFEQLASSLGEWVSMAASSGVAVDDAASALAAMTLSGMDASEAATSLSRVMQAFIAPGKSMTALIAQMGYESGTTMLQTIGLHGAIEAIRETTGGTSSTMIDLFEEIRGARGAMALMSNEGANYTSTFEGITDVTARAGASQKAFNVQAGGLGAQMTIMKNEITALGISIGTGLVPVVHAVVTPLITFLDVLNSVPEPVKQMIVGFAAMGTAIMLLGGLFLMLRARAFLTRIAFQGVGAGLSWLGKTGNASNALSRIGYQFTEIGEKRSRIFGAGMAGARVAMEKFSSWLHSGRTGALLSSWGAQISGALGTMSAKMIAIGKRSGPIGSIATSFNGVISVMMRFHKTALLLTAIKWIGIATVATVALVLLSGWLDRANEKARKLNQTWLKSLPSGTVNEATDSIKQLDDKIRELGDDIGKGPGSLEGWKRSAENILKGDFFNKNMAQANQAFKDDVKEREYLQNKLAMLNGTFDLAMGKPLPSAFDTPAMKVSADASRDQFKKYVESRNVDITIKSDFRVDPEGYERERAAIQSNLEDLWQEFNHGPASVNAVKAAIFDLGKVFDTGADKIEGLGKVLDAFFAADFGARSAADDVEGAFNDLYKNVQTLKEHGTLAEALNPKSMHEDAIAMRKELDGITKMLADDVLAGLKDDPGMTAMKFSDEIDKRKAKLIEYGHSIGITDEAMKPYLEHLDKIAKDRVLSVKINNNATDATTAVYQYLTALGLAPEEITTALTVFKEKGQAGLESYLATVRVTDNAEVRTVVTLVKEQAVADMKAWQAAVGASDETITTLINLKVNGKPGDVEAKLREMNIPEGQIQAFINIIGTGSLDSALAILNGKIQDIQDEKAIKFHIDRSIYGEITELQTALDLAVRTEKELGTLRSSVGVQTPNSRFETPAPWTGTATTTPTPTTGYYGTGQPYVPPALRDPNIGYNAEGSHTAQISRSMRVWAEPETGGEAYIPLAASKRSRSLAIWAQTGKSLGVRGFADGSNEMPPTDFSKRVYTAPTAATGSGSGTQATDPWTIVVNMHTVGDMSDEAFKASLQGRLNTLEKYSGDWQSAWEDLKQFDDKAAEDEKNKWVQISGMIENAFQIGEFDPGQYKAMLDSQLAGTQKYSDEWMAIWQKIQTFNEKNKATEDDRIQKQKDAIDKEEKVLAYRNDKGEVSNADYLKILRDRIAKETQYSDRWFDLQSRIDDAEKRVIDAQQKIIDDKKTQSDERQRLNSVLFDVGMTSRSEYLAILRKDLAEAATYSDEWLTLTNKIKELTGAGAVKSMGDITSAPFTNQYISANAVVGFFEKQAKKATDWAKILKDLSASGVSATIMNQLVDAGPDSLPMAQALMRVYADPAMKSRFTAAQTTISTISSSFNPAPAQPIGSSTNFQSGNWQGKGLTVNGPLVNVESYSASSPTDVDMIANQLSFSIRSSIA